MALDTLRGIAALAVVVFHWRHFFYAGSDLGPFDLSRLPLADVGRVVYAYGWLAVDLFFCLSGFIFFYLYSQGLAAGRMTAARFAWLRFSRLYPLHFLTLCLVMVGQVLTVRRSGAPFVYDNNDGWHFLLNLGLASSWGLERGWSFNGPAWSISVEVLLYAAFFVYCRFAPVRPWTTILVAFVGFFGVTRLYEPVGRGLGSFFVGGSVYWLHRNTLESGHARQLAQGAAIAAVLAAWTMTLMAIHHPGTAQSIGSWGGAALPSAWADWIGSRFVAYWPMFVLFPCTVLSLALIESTSGWPRRSFTLLGDISYSSYLLHFPLQLVVAIVFASAGIERDIYYSSSFMCAFLLLLVVLSLVSYYYFERPCQTFLRRFVRSRG